MFFEQNTYLRLGLEGRLARVGPLSGEVVLARVGLWVLQNATQWIWKVNLNCSELFLWLA